RQEASFSPPSYIVPLQPRGSRPPFFCMPMGGGLLEIYMELVRELGRDQPLFGLQSKEMDGEPCISRIEDMAGVYVDAIRGVQPCGPYQITGMSMGGVVAYETARQLMAAGHEVSLLALLDTFFSPEPLDREMSDEDIRELARANLIPNAQRVLQIHPDEMAGLS